MSTILFCVSAMAGSVNATRKLARDLRKNGHTIHYVGIADCQYLLTDESFFPVFTNLFPASQRLKASQRKPSFWERIQSGRMRTRRYRELIGRMMGGTYDGFDKVIEGLRPDLIIIVSSVWYAVLWGLLAHQFNVPSLYLNDSLTGPENSLVPPITSPLVPLCGVLGHARTWVEWKLHKTRTRVQNLRGRLLRDMNLTRLAKQLAGCFNFPADLLYEDEQFLRTKALEVLLFPEAFDFPHHTRPDRRYASASVDLARTEGAFPWERLRPETPVIYCSMGTLNLLRPQEYIRFYECVIRAFETFADRYQLVLVAGESVESHNLKDVSHNVIVVQRAPQMALLKRSVLMINHGGSNTVKECVTLGVPMLLYPLAFDHFGFAARAVYHGLGLQGDAQRVTVAEMRRDIHRLLTEPYYRLQIRRMRNEFSLAEDTHSPTLFIEGLLRSC